MKRKEEERHVTIADCRAKGLLFLIERYYATLQLSAECVSDNLMCKLVFLQFS